MKLSHALTFGKALCKGSSCTLRPALLALEPPRSQQKIITFAVVWCHACLLASSVPASLCNLSEQWMDQLSPCTLSKHSWLQPWLHQAVAAPSNSANPPFPPSLKRLMDIADKRPTGRDEKMLAAYSNLTVARYFLHHAAVPLVSATTLKMHNVTILCYCATPRFYIYGNMSKFTFDHTHLQIMS